MSQNVGSLQIFKIGLCLSQKFTFGCQITRVGALLSSVNMLCTLHTSGCTFSSRVHGLISCRPDSEKEINKKQPSDRADLSTSQKGCRLHSSARNPS